MTARRQAEPAGASPAGAFWEASDLASRSPMVILTMVNFSTKLTFNARDCQ